jgi:signal transduction histidine kinase
MATDSLPTVRSGRWIAFDTVVACVLWLLIAGGVSRTGKLTSLLVPTAPHAVAYALVTIATAGVAVRRLHPVPVLAAVAAAALSVFALGYAKDPTITVALVLYTVVVSQRLRTAVAALFVVEGGVVAAVATTPFPLTYDGTTQWADRFGLFVTLASIQLAAWAIGFAVRRQRAYMAAVSDRAERQIQAQRELMWRSVTEERLRIARELHDVVAHSMSVIAVQAGVGSYVGEDQPGRAKDALSAIEATSREALWEMRRLLGVLRGEPGTDTPEFLPAPSLADLKTLISRTTDAGLRAELRVVGTPSDLPSGIELAAYRITQEALTNVIKHAHTDRCRVVVTYCSEALEVEVTDDGVGAAALHPDGGHGIIGMRERASLYGGELTAGPLPVRGYRVATRLPVAERAP